MHQHTQRVRLPGTRVRAVLIQLIPVERVEPVLAQQLPFTQHRRHNTRTQLPSTDYQLPLPLPRDQCELQVAPRSPLVP